MSERVAKQVRREIRKRLRTDFDKFTEAVRDLPFTSRVRFCLRILIGRPRMGRRQS